MAKNTKSKKSAEIVGTPAPVDATVEVAPVVEQAPQEPDVAPPTFPTAEELLSEFKTLAFAASSAQNRVKSWDDLKIRKVLTRTGVRRTVCDVLIDHPDKKYVDAFWIYWKTHKVQLKAAGAAVSQRVSSASPVFSASIWGTPPAE